METNDTRAFARFVILALVSVGIWFLGTKFTGQPAPSGLDARQTEFSAARAELTLGRLLGPQIPHPVSTAANMAVRDRVRAEFAALGVRTRVYRGTGCFGRAKNGFFACGTTEDIVAEVAPGEGKAIVLLAHYDSVPAGPGAADDQSSVASILEAVRALKARGIKTMHPILAVITDGEEAGLLGADAFLSNPELKARVGVVVNAEARGNQGPSLMFQTSPGNGRLIDLYARYVPQPAASSLTSVIYKLLPNDTDLTLFINQGFTSYNFAFNGNVAHYHTPLDNRENLSPASLQHQGDNILGMTSGLMRTDFASLKGGDDIYVAVLGKFLPRMPATWALPLSLFALALLVGAAFLSRGEVLGIGRRLMAIAMPLAAILACGLFGWLLHEVAVLVSGNADPSYAYPLFMRVSLAIGVAASLLLVSRMASARMAALSVWFWFAGLAVVTGALLPGLSPYFLFPALVGSVLVVLQSRLPGAWSGTLGGIALFLAALTPLVILLSLVGGAESVGGLLLHPLFTIPAALGTMSLIPVMAGDPLSRRGWIMLTPLVAVAAIAVAIVAGSQPAYSTITPQRLSIGFVDEHIVGKAFWTIDTQGVLPKAFRDAAAFSAKPERISPMSFQPSYLAPAGATRFPAPTADIVSTPQGAGRTVTLTLHGSESANEMLVAVPPNAGLNRIEFESKSFVPSRIRRIRGGRSSAASRAIAVQSR